MDIEKYFAELRFDEKHHLGLGDIRLSVGQQEEIVSAFKKQTACSQSELDGGLTSLGFAAAALEGIADILERTVLPLGDPKLDEVNEYVNGIRSTLALIRLAS